LVRRRGRSAPPHIVDRRGLIDWPHSSSTTIQTPRAGAMTAAKSVPFASMPDVQRTPNVRSGVHLKAIIPTGQPAPNGGTVRACLFGIDHARYSSPRRTSHDNAERRNAGHDCAYRIKGAARRHRYLARAGQVSCRVGCRGGQRPSPSRLPPALPHSGAGITPPASGRSMMRSTVA
jgi:hypothetical protein